MKDGQIGITSVSGDTQRLTTLKHLKKKEIKIKYKTSNKLKKK